MIYRTDHQRENMRSRMEILSATESCEQNGGGRPVAPEPEDCEDRPPAYDWWDCLHEAACCLTRARVDRETAGPHVAEAKKWIEAAEKEMRL